MHPHTVHLPTHYTQGRARLSDILQQQRALELDIQAARTQIQVLEEQVQEERSKVCYPLFLEGNWCALCALCLYAVCRFV